MHKSKTGAASRRNRAFFVPAGLSVGLMLVFSGLVVVAQGQIPQTDEDRLVELINSERSGAGLGALAPDPDLIDIARNHAGAMAAGGRVFDDPKLQQEVSGSGAAGQNSASGQDAGAIHQNLIANPQAKNKMLGGYDKLGVGAIRSAAGILYVSEVFSRSAPEHPGPAPASEDAKGRHFGGLDRPSEGRCSGALRTINSRRCTHGPDQVPEGVDITQDARPVASSASDATSTAAATTTAASSTGIVCDGDGVSGKRFQAIYARASDRADRYSTFASSIAVWAANAGKAFNNSAALTGGSRQPRWVTDSGCNLSIANVVLSAAGDDTFDNTINELASKGYTSTNRAYVVWMDANVYCGIGTIDIDDSPGSSNFNNTGPNFARTDAGCWGQANSVEAHEMMHTLGGVQRTAPHSTYRLSPTDPGTFHCFDESDRMCYVDAAGVVLQTLCPDSSKEALFDCNGDDYFNVAPGTGNYLATHWNAANSDFLIKPQAASTSTGKYTALTPARILDTRDGTGGVVGQVAPGQTINLLVSPAGGIPTGASAVMLNVAVTQPTAPSHLTIFPSGTVRPNAANLNFTTGQTTSNLVVAKVGSAGQISIFNNSGSVHIIVDVQGYYSAAGSGAAASSAQSAASSPSPAASPASTQVAPPAQQEPGSTPATPAPPGGQVLTVGQIAGNLVAGVVATVQEVLKPIQQPPKT